MKRRVYMICVILIVVLGICSPFSVSAEQGEFSNSYIFNIKYPDDDGDVKIEARTKSDLLETTVEEFDRSNLVFYKDEAYDVELPFPVDDLEINSMKQGMRTILLKSGYAKLLNESIASKIELDAQNEAREKQLGFWKEKAGLQEENGETTVAEIKETTEYNAEETIGGKIEESKQESEDDGEKRSEFWLWNLSNVLALIAIIIAIGACGVAVVALVRDIRRDNKEREEREQQIKMQEQHTKRRVILLGGVSNSGKTTLLTRMKYPKLKNKDLPGRAATLNKKESHVINFDPNRELELRARIIDNSGDDSHELIDEINQIIDRDEYVLILIVSPVKANKKSKNKIEDNYVDEQLSRLQSLWVPILKAKSMPNPRNVIMVVNKKGRFKKSEKIEKKFEPHKQLLEEISKTLEGENAFKFQYVNGSVIEKSTYYEIMEILMQ